MVAKSNEVTTISSGQTVSGFVKASFVDYFGILAPTIDSCQLFLQVNVDQTSADFRRLFQTGGSSHWVWNVGPGSGAVVVGEASKFPFPQIRLETSEAQTDVRSFTISRMR